MNENPQRLISSGSFDDEPAAWKFFDDTISQCGLFQSYSEVDGWMLHPRQDSEIKRVRIDRILTPTKKLISAGWNQGIIGVEGKKSGKKMGPAICQAMDYSRSVFELHPYMFLVMVRWVFLWPTERSFNDLGSVLANHRIGWVKTSGYAPLVFGCDAINAITIRRDGTCEVHDMPMGKKTGSR